MYRLFSVKVMQHIIEQHIVIRNPRSTRYVRNPQAHLLCKKSLSTIIFNDLLYICYFKICLIRVIQGLALFILFKDLLYTFYLTICFIHET